MPRHCAALSLFHALLLSIMLAGCASSLSPSPQAPEGDATAQDTASPPRPTTQPKPSVTVLPGGADPADTHYADALKLALANAGYPVLSVNAQCRLTPILKVEEQESAKRRRMMPGFGLEVAAIKAVIGAGKYLYEKEFAPETADATLRIQCAGEPVELTRHYEHLDHNPEEMYTAVAREQVLLMDSFVAGDLNEAMR